MPIIGESPPLIFGGPTTPTPTRTPGTTPRPTRTPGPPTPYPTGTPAPSVNFVSRHEQFINRVDQLGSCFTRQDLPDFSDQEFLDHYTVAAKDKYLTKDQGTPGMICSMQGLNALIGSLKRLGEE